MSHCAHCPPLSMSGWSCRCRPLWAQGSSWLSASSASLCEEKGRPDLESGPPTGQGPFKIDSLSCALTLPQGWEGSPGLSFGCYEISAYHLMIRFVKWSEVAQSCLTLCDPVDCSLPGSSVHGILQARILEWVAISFSRESSQPRDWTQVSHIVGRRLNLWATREAHV